MSLNQIQLSSTLMSELYTNSLVGLKETNSGAQKQFKEESGWNYIGENEKNILILVNYPGQIQLTEQQFSLLNNMLLACKISVTDIVLMNLGQNPNANHKKLNEHFKSKVVLLFGIEPASIGLPLSFPHFQVQTFANCTFLFTPTFEELKNADVLRSKLWVCLRRIFGI